MKNVIYLNASGIDYKKNLFYNLYYRKFEKREENNMSKNVIRRAEEKDIGRVHELLIQVDMVHHNARPDLFKSYSVKYTDDELKEIFKNDSTPVFVYADDEDKVVGYAFCIFKQYTNDNILTDIKTLYIDDLCVDEAARGQGIGKALYDYAVEYAKEQGCYNLTLNVWASNAGALRFYEKCGLKPQKICMETFL